MKRNEILSYVCDFVSLLMSNAGNDLKDIILFGSVARGDFDEESDVDIFVNASKEKIIHVQGAVNKSVNEFELISSKTWKLKGIDLPIKCIVGDIEAEKWSALRREIISSGICLYGKYKSAQKGLSQRFLFSFGLANLRHKNQVSIVRNIYGYSSGAGKKAHKVSGLLEKLGGQKLNPGVVLIPAESYKEFYEFLKSKKVSPKIIEVWAD